MKTLCSPRADAREQILMAAAQCFTEKGFHASSIDDVAGRLKATKGFIYHHYRSKIELFFDVYQVGMDALLSAVRAASTVSGPPLELLRAMLLVHIRVMFEYYAFEHVVAQAVQLHRFHALTPAQRSRMDVLMAERDALENLYKAVIRDGQRCGDFATDIDPSIAARTVLGGVHWSLIWYRPDLGRTPAQIDRLAHHMVQTLLKGMQRRS